LRRISIDPTAAEHALPRAIGYASEMSPRRYILARPHQYTL
jgi:hypothetical protein